MAPQSVQEWGLGFGVLAIGSLAMALNGCGDSEELDEVVAQLSERCSLNSHCASPLVCSFEHCHTECESDRDCRPARCVQSDAPDVFVCQLENETACDSNADCPIPLVCGPDGECRGRCQDADDCPQGQICTAESGLCAGENEVDDNDELSVDGESSDPDGKSRDGGPGAPQSTTTDASSGDTTDAEDLADESSTDASDTDASDSDASDSDASDTDASDTADLDATEADELESSSSAGGDGTQASDELESMTDEVNSSDSAEGETEMMSSTDQTEPEEIPEGLDHYEGEGEETVNNDDRDHSVELTTAASVWLLRGDEDWFTVDVPEGNGAQIIEVRLFQGAGAHTLVEALAGDDFSRIGGFNTQVGTTSYFYVTVAPGSRTLLRLSGNNRSGARVDVEVQITPEVDDYEPNDQQEQAQLVELGTPVTAQMIQAYQSQVAPPSDDWFAVDVDAGELEIQLLSVPDNLRLSVSQHTEAASATLGITSAGALGRWVIDVQEPGRIWLQLSGYQQAAFFSGARPAHLDDAYSFVIQQPPSE